MEITNTTPLKPGRYWKSERTKYVLNKHFPHRKFVQKIDIQLNIQNKASGTAASSDLVITSNAGTDSTNYSHKKQ